MQEISIEVDISRKTLHAFSVVGLPDKAVEESRDRISAAIKNSGFTSPKTKNEKVVVSLAPAALRKEGALFDLPIALGYLQASRDVDIDVCEKLFVGELSLDGRVRGVNGVLGITEYARRNGFKEVYVPKENAKEAALVGGIRVYGVTSLIEIVNHLDGRRESHATIVPQERVFVTRKAISSSVLFDDIRGQEHAKRGLLIAAAGGHNIALFGPPGTGKTMLARAFASTLPPLTPEKVVETTSIHSAAGVLEGAFITTPPLRSPHHNASHAAIIGGGSIPKPGEVTLAHNGILFLDEFPEFERRVIDGLRTPLEEQVVHISRAKGSVSFPADFILIATMNPCPCGNFGSEKECICMPHKREQYAKKISGPVIDRIDMWIEVPRIPLADIAKKGSKGEHKKAVVCVQKARDIQDVRYGGGRVNSRLSVRGLEHHIRLTNPVQNTLHQAIKTLGLSARAYHRLLKLSRTIADLDGSNDITEAHVLEAIQYRFKQ